MIRLCVVVCGWNQLTGKSTGSDQASAKSPQELHSMLVAAMSDKQQALVVQKRERKNRKKERRQKAAASEGKEEETEEDQASSPVQQKVVYTPGAAVDEKDFNCAINGHVMKEPMRAPNRRRMVRRTPYQL